MRGLLSIVLLTLCIGCVEPYFPEILSQQLNLLVIDGAIGSDGHASVTLSRTTDMNTSILNVPTEKGATVMIESSSGETYELSEERTGTYTAVDLDIHHDDTFTLHIKTSNGEEYRSDEVKIYQTPPIDSIYWTVSASGKNIEVRVNSKDKDPNTTGFYAWDCVETYEYHAQIHSAYKFLGRNAVRRLPEEEIFTCWRDELVPSTVFDTHILTEPTVSGIPIQIIPQYSKKIGVRYSILVKQRTISEADYTFRSQLKTSTNNTGSLFSVIPGSVVGNVRSILNPDEYVLGYFRAEDVKTRRFFISVDELPGPFKIQLRDFCDTEETCHTDVPPKGPNLCVDINTLSENTPIVGVVSSNAVQVALIFTSPMCGDCRAWGGTVTKPPFW